MEKRHLFRQANGASGGRRLFERRVVQSPARFCFGSRGRLSVSARIVQTQVVAGLLEPGLQSDVFRRLARRGSGGCKVDPARGDE